MMAELVPHKLCELVDWHGAFSKTKQTSQPWWLKQAVKKWVQSTPAMEKSNAKKTQILNTNYGAVWRK